jgi:hypothetical protein
MIKVPDRNDYTWSTHPQAATRSALGLATLAAVPAAGALSSLASQARIRPGSTSPGMIGAKPPDHHVPQETSTRSAKKRKPRRLKQPRPSAVGPSIVSPAVQSGNSRTGCASVSRPQKTLSSRSPTTNSRARWSSSHDPGTRKALPLRLSHGGSGKAIDADGDKWWPTGEDVFYCSDCAASVRAPDRDNPNDDQKEED